MTERRYCELNDYFRRFQQWKPATEFREHYKTGARVWVPHPESVWEGGEVVEDFSAKTLKIKTDSGEVLTLSITSDENLPPLRNPDILIGENDLTSLSYLHEPAVLYNLQFRFCSQNSIYTYCGIVLVAINPYSELPIYNSETILEYRGKSMGELDPHIFAVAEEAYTKMEREQRDQSIIVSGESGAGKTVSAKYAMRYFATVGGSTTETHIEKKVLASSPIMEAIGNAKTTRNDNSSRFGKFIELNFSKNYNIVGASMRTYLLEKSRVVFQAPEERNYHILYQLCAARKDYPRLQLGSAKTYKYLCQEDVITGVDDLKSFQDTLTALQTLGFSEHKISNLFKVFASILHLGNIRILENAAHSDADASYIENNDPHLIAFTELLELDAEELRTWLCHRRIISMRESFDKPMTLTEATGARDALAKHMYAELFNWIVEIINHSLESSSDTRHKFIGVLDIYGFETFETNSFEQFCINYANEKLQQQFNQHVFKLEQEEYLKEEIEWKFIDFYDNQPCIDLIETKLGILDLLDEECRMPKGSDGTWAEKLYTKCTKWQHFEKPRFGTNAFVIKHFADRVEYEVIGFLDKNRDTVIEEQVALLRNGGNKLVSKLFSDSKNLQLPATMTNPTKKVKMTVSSKRTFPTMGPASKHKKTVGSQFRDSLNALMSTLNATTPHYIRCIKPNDNKLPFEYDAHRAVQQLRACGVLETIRISAAGFPSRWLYMDFFNRYRVLCRSSDIKREDPKLTCQRILSNVIKASDRYKFGKNKIFFRAGQVAYLERLRSDRMRECCIMIQKSTRGFLLRRRYIKLQNSTITFQRFVRGFLARRRVHAMRQNKAAVTIQRYVRGWVKRVQYQRLQNIMMRLQALGRGLLARKRFLEMKRNHAATIIQKAVRGFLCRQHYERDRCHVVIAQNAVRRFLARRLFKRLKREAKSVEHVKSLNKGLENKIISLQQRIGVLLKENNSLKGCSIELNETRSKLEQLRGADNDLKKVKLLLQEKEETITKLINDLEKEKIEKLDIIVEKDQLESKYNEEKNVWNLETKSLNEKINELNEKMITANSNVEDVLRSKFEREKLDIIREQDHDRDAYQKLITEKNILENNCDSLQRELAKLTGNKNYYSNHTRSLSDASTVSVIEESSNLPIELHEEDYGYGSVRSNGSRNTDRSFPLDWSQETTPESTLTRPTKVLVHNSTSIASPPTETQTIDVGLVLKLQQKLKKLEHERDLLHRQIEERNDSPSEQKTHDAFKVQEFEMENSKLKADLESLRRAFAESTTLGKPKADELISQFQKQEEELVRRREECVQLREVLANRTTGLKNVASTNYSSEDFDIALINEDGELVLALEAQKKINRQLVDELQSCRMRWNIEREELVAELERLRGETENQQKLLSINLSKSPKTQTEAYMHHEITRLSSENLDLQNKRDLAVEDYRNLKKHLKEIKRKLKEAGVENLLETPEVTSSTETQIATNQPVVRLKERTYLGMFEFKAGDENVIIKHLVWELKPQTAVKLLPGLPAYILFMCIRHTDYTNDEKKVRALLTGFINVVKKVIRKRPNDLDLTVLWLSNTLRFLHNLKQYSGEKTFKEENTATQNEQCLRNFDLSEYRKVLSDIAVWIYQGVIHQMQEKVQQKAVAAILEHDAIPGLSSSCKRGRGSSVSDVPNQQPLDSLLEELTSFHRTLGLHGVDPELIVQVFRQLFYYICASSLNNLLLRKDLCHWSKGMQIRYNLSHVEQWSRDQKLQDPIIIDMLAPIIQAAQLLQARKTDEDVTSVCEMCHRMTAHQILKLLNLCTPANDFEERVSMSFIRKIQQKLKERTDFQDQTLLMDTKFNFSVKFPFNPSNISLEDIEIPESLNLPMLKKV